MTQSADIFHLELLSLRAVVNSIGAYIFTKDTQGRYTYANELACELFGRPLHEVVGSDDREFFELEAPTASGPKRCILIAPTSSSLWPFGYQYLKL